MPSSHQALVTLKQSGRGGRQRLSGLHRPPKLLTGPARIARTREVREVLGKGVGACLRGRRTRAASQAIGKLLTWILRKGRPGVHVAESVDIQAGS